METQAYRGYLIRSNPFNGSTWVEKDGYRIVAVPDVSAGRHNVDVLLCLVDPCTCGTCPAAQPKGGK